MNEIVKTNNGMMPIEKALIDNDLSSLSENDRMKYYISICESLKLNHLTQPFAYIRLNGKLCLYAKRDAADQLRKIHQISITIREKKFENDLYIVTVQAKNKEGREDESTGAVSIANLKGDNLANALMKCETKAKRRVTLSICGLGLLDEDEIDSIPEPYAPINYKEREALILAIQSELSRQTAGKTLEQKSVYLLDVCKVSQFKELNSKSIEDLQKILDALREKMLETSSGG